MNITKVIQYLHPDAEFVLVGNDLFGLTWFGPGDAPTLAELEAAEAAAEHDEAHRKVEAQRRARYQSETDGMFFAAQRDGGNLSAWQSAVDIIKTELPYPVFNNENTGEDGYFEGEDFYYDEEISTEGES